MRQFKKILKFWRLIDSEGLLSLTNLAVLVVMIKIILVPATSIADLGVLLVSLLNYAHKRYTTTSTKISLLEGRFDEYEEKTRHFRKQMEINNIEILDRISKLGLSVGRGMDDDRTNPKF